MHLNTAKASHFKANRQSGISLIEILVSIVIISIGMLGLAAMQNSSMRLAYDSYIRTQSSFLAYDLIDRIRANPEAPPYTLAPGQVITQQDCFGVNANCGVAQLRQFDLYYWQQYAEQLLPEARFEIDYDEDLQQYSMVVSWNDRVDGDVENIPGQTESKEFVYHFQVEKQ
jgi:type IV pilus assembly protein PilV